MAFCAKNCEQRPNIFLITQHRSDEITGEAEEAGVESNILEGLGGKACSSLSLLLEVKNSDCLHQHITPSAHHPSQESILWRGEEGPPGSLLGSQPPWGRRAPASRFLLRQHTPEGLPRNSKHAHASKGQEAGCQNQQMPISNILEITMSRKKQPQISHLFTLPTPSRCAKTAAKRAAFPVG